MYSSHSIDSDDDHRIPIYIWEPAVSPTAIIQIFHGLGEHVTRYDRFARAAAESGYSVYAHNHRGHGPESNEIGFFASEQGWDKLVQDGHAVTKFVQQKSAGLPLILLGHSMGSYIAQSYAIRFGEELTALVLSGSTWPSRVQVFIGRLLARFEAWRLGLHGTSPLLDKLGFGDFNKKFEPARTELDWLSRDHDEVDAYINDSLCGGPYSTGLWIDLLGGLLSISKDDALRAIPESLPILITGGADDPVGGQAGMNKLSAHYAATGHDNLDTRIYAGGRHEMLNETNRDEFTNDLLGWIAKQLSHHHS